MCKESVLSKKFSFPEIEEKEDEDKNRDEYLPPAKWTRLSLLINAVEGLLDYEDHKEEDDGEEGEVYKYLSTGDNNIFLDKSWIHLPDELEFRLAL